MTTWVLSPLVALNPIMPSLGVLVLLAAAADTADSEVVEMT